MRIKKLIAKSNSRNILLLVVSTASLFSCQPLPKNIGVSSSISEIGIVYTAKIKAIYPIFVPTFVNNSYADGIAEVAGVIVEDIYGKSRRVFQYSSIASSFARTGTGIYEERYAGYHCHYILEINNDSLIQDIKDSDNYDDDNNDFDANNYSSEHNSNFDENYSNNNDAESISDSSETHLKIDENSGFVLMDEDNNEVDRIEAEKSVNQLFKEQLEELISINIEKEKEIQLLLQKKKNIPKVFVVNPCRDFQIDSLVTISKSENEVILQPNYMNGLF